MQVLKMPEPTNQASSVSELIGDLLFQLDTEDINYCHWKSNWKIDRWLEGEGDLDLLVKRGDIGKFTAVLSELGFKKVLTPPEMEVPGILNFYGFDSTTQKLVHVHAHYQLVFGHDLTKNYRLPIEDAYLASAVRSGEIIIAAPEMELILFVLRMVLKFSPLETFARYAMRKSKKHFATIVEELKYLETQVDDLKLITAFQQHFPMISSQLFDDCVESLQSKATIWQRISVKRRLEKELSVYGRMSGWAEKLTKFKRRIIFSFRRFIRRKKPLKRFESGGVLIAIVGGDGAGKTTCVNEIYGWLSKKFETRRFHLGKPPKSVLTLSVAGMLKIKRKINAIRGKSLESEEVNLTALKTGFLQQLRWVCTARDRFWLYRKIRRLAANGAIVICDRYPVPNLRLMDSPKITPVSYNFRLFNRLQELLSQLENYYYGRIISPDFMFVLRVEPDTAVIRKTDEAKVHVFSRSKELWNFNWQGIPARLIDAGRPLAEVLADLRLSIWRVL